MSLDPKILAKLNALRAKMADSGATEAEVLEASAMFARMMERYDVSEAMLGDDKHDNDIDFLDVELNSTALDHTISYALSGLMALTETAVLIITKRPSNLKSLRIYGTEHEREFAGYLVRTLIETERRAWRDRPSQIGASHKARVNFKAGFGARISIRLRELADQRRAARDDILAKSHALVPTQSKSARIILAMGKAAKAPSQRNTGIRNIDPRAILDGSNAASKVPLTRPLT